MAMDCLDIKVAKPEQNQPYFIGWDPTCKHVRLKIPEILFFNFEKP